MSELRATLLVGLLAVVSVALVILGVVNTSRDIGDEDATYVVEAIFDDVTGIAAGTKVTIAGYPVGEVTQVRLRGTEVQVLLRVRNEIQLFGGVMRDDKLVNAAMLTRVQASLLGDYYLELRPGAAGKKLGPGGRVPIVVTATAIEATLKRLETAADVIPNVNRIASDVAAITSNARKVFGSEDGAQRFDEIADNLVTTSRNLSDASDGVRKRLQTGTLAPGGELDKTITDAASFLRQANQLAGEVRGTWTRGGDSALRSLDHVEAVTKGVRAMLGRNERGLDESIASLTQTLAKVEDTLKRFDGVVANLEDVTARARRGEGAVGRLLTNDTLVREAEAMVKQTRSFVSRFVNLQTGIDFQTNYYAPAQDGRETWRSQLSLRVQPSTEKYYLASVSGDVVPNTTTLVRRTDVSGAGGPATTTEGIFEAGDNVKFGFQYVRRFGPMALRGGLIESRAGFGVDAFAWHDRIQVWAEVFALTDPRPRLRAGVIARLLSFAYVQVGGDFLLTPERALFVGAGLFFRDDDLMLLFASAPSVQF